MPVVVKHAVITTDTMGDDKKKINMVLVRFFFFKYVDNYLVSIQQKYQKIKPFMITYIP